MVNMTDIVKMLSDKYKVILSAAAIDKFNSVFSRREYQKDEIIVNHGKIFKDVYIIEKGMNTHQK